MKKLIVSSLLASLLFVVPALANEINGNNECNSKFNSAGCPNVRPRVLPPDPQPPIIYPPPPRPVGPPPVVYGDGFGHRWRDRDLGGIFFNFGTNPDNGDYDNGYNDGYDDNYDDNYVDRCTAVGQSLRRSGFKRVRAIGCGGRNYIYTAFRDGEALRITVSRNTGRIVRIRPIY